MRATSLFARFSSQQKIGHLVREVLLHRVMTLRWAHFGRPCRSLFKDRGVTGNATRKLIACGGQAAKSPAIERSFLSGGKRKVINKEKCNQNARRNHGKRNRWILPQFFQAVGHTQTLLC